MHPLTNVRRGRRSGVLAGGGGGPWSPLKIFRGRQKLEKGANDARTPFVGRNSEFGKTEELFNSLGCLRFVEGRVAKTARAL